MHLQNNNLSGYKNLGVKHFKPDRLYSKKVRAFVKLTALFYKQCNVAIR